MATGRIRPGTRAASKTCTTPRPTPTGVGLTPLSYWDYMNDLVSRYADSPALGMWEPMSEAEASTCPAADRTEQLWGTPDLSGRGSRRQRIELLLHHSRRSDPLLDPEHLVEAGFLGVGQCGTAGTDYESVGASPGIDVLSVHDYYGSVPLGGDQWNGMAVRFAQAKALDKPIITGEAGNRGRHRPEPAARACSSARMTWRRR